MLTYRGTVYPWHCDHMGHMNVMWYVGKFDEATWQLFSAIGLGPSRLAASQRGMAAVDQRITYAREVKAGAVVSIASVLGEVHERKIRFTHEMRNDETGVLVASTTLVGVHMDTLARRAVAFPEGVIEAAKALLSADRSTATDAVSART
ncbi:MAG: acyl-CoA thioesterase [Burkholderiaceae bacterium]|nr:acyl-CoA thioesterase [Burkholderiaceae bacterium]